MAGLTAGVGQRVMNVPNEMAHSSNISQLQKPSFRTRSAAVSGTMGSSSILGPTATETLEIPDSADAVSVGLSQAPSPNNEDTALV